MTPLEHATKRLDLEHEINRQRRMYDRGIWQMIGCFVLILLDLGLLGGFIVFGFMFHEAWFAIASVWGVFAVLLGGAGLIALMCDCYWPYGQVLQAELTLKKHDLIPIDYDI